MRLTNKPEYSDDRRIHMTAYMGPRRGGKHWYQYEYGKYPLDPEEGYPSFITDEVFQLYKDAGLDFLMPEGDAYYGVCLTKDGFVEEPDFEKSDLYSYMEVAKRNGLDVYPAIEEVFMRMTHEDGPFGEKEKALFKDFVETIQAHFPETFKGIMLTDEPSYAELGRVKKMVDYLHSEEIQSIKPGLSIFSSMLPIYGALVSYHPDYADDKYKKSGYDADRSTAYGLYLDACADAMREISFDYYPLVYENQVTPSYYMNLEMGAERCLERKCPLAITIQSCRMDIDYNDKTGRSKVVYRAPDYEGMRWQVYSALAFGAERIGYYTFWTHYNQVPGLVYPKAMVVYDPSDEKGYRTTEIYDAVKEVNQEILEFDHVFLRFKWQGCRVIRTSRDRNIRLVKGGYEQGCLKDIKSTRDTLVGCMKNPEDGREGYWIVNAENPFRSQNNDIEVLFEGMKRLICYRKGKECDMTLEQVIIGGKTYGKFAMRMGVGEGIFTIPY